MSESPNRKSTATDKIIWTTIGILVFGAVLAIAIPNFVKSRQTTYSPGMLCINNLRQMNAAAQQWALETGQNSNAIVTLAAIKPYIKLNSAGNIPPCPAGGTYSATWSITNSPTCTMSTATPAHKLR